jgi:hypothetical protein
LGDGRGGARWLFAVEKTSVHPIETESTGTSTGLLETVLWTTFTHSHTHKVDPGLDANVFRHEPEKRDIISGILNVICLT